MLRNTLLPALTLGVYVSGIFARFLRASLVGELRADYVRTARSKGLRERDVVGRHVLRNALLPFVTVVGLMLADFVGGTVVTEAVFTYPGLGRLLIQAIGTRDYPLIQGCILVILVHLRRHQRRGRRALRLYRPAHRIRLMAPKMRTVAVPPRCSTSRARSRSSPAPRAASAGRSRRRSRPPARRWSSTAAMPRPSTPRRACARAMAASRPRSRAFDVTRRRCRGRRRRRHRARVTAASTSCSAMPARSCASRCSSRRDADWQIRHRGRPHRGLAPGPRGGAADGAGAATAGSSSSRRSWGMSRGRAITGYVAAKTGLHGLVRALAVELAPNGITVNALAPGYFPDRGQQRLRAQRSGLRAADRRAARRWVAGAIRANSAPPPLYLASPRRGLHDRQRADRRRRADCRDLNSEKKDEA